MRIAVAQLLLYQFLLLEQVMFPQFIAHHLRQTVFSLERGLQLSLKWIMQILHRQLR